MDHNSFIPEEKQKPFAIPQRRQFGRKKRKRAPIDPDFPKPCVICNIVLIRKFEYEAHLKGKRHVKAVKMKEVREQLEKEIAAETAKQTEGLVVFDPESSRRTCTVCNLTFSSPMIEVSHMNGKRHKRTVAIKNGLIVQGKPKKGYVGRCEICKVSYTSTVMMKSHLAGKNHKKKCKKIVVPDGREIPSSTDEQPPVKKMKLQPVLSPTPVIKPAAKEPHELLEKQAEEAYQNYLNLAPTLSLGDAQALYMKYQNIYRAYEAAYQKHMTGKVDT